MQLHTHIYIYLFTGTGRRQGHCHDEHTEGGQGAHHAGTAERGEQTRPTLHHSHGDRGQGAGQQTRQLERQPK